MKVRKQKIGSVLSVLVLLLPVREMTGLRLVM